MFLIRLLRHAYLEKSWRRGETVVRCLKKVLKNSNGTSHTSHRPTWWRDSPVSQSLRAECPKYGCMGGLAPGPNH